MPDNRQHAKGEARPQARSVQARRLRLLATTDLHMQLGGAASGLARIASLIAEERATAAREGAICLLVDNGDALQGGALGELAAEEPERPHPVMRAFAHLGYDVLGLGNHDFDLGLERLEAVLAQAACPVVCSNLGPVRGVLPWLVLARAGLRIGVISALPPQTAVWNRHHLEGRAEARDIVAAAREAVQALRLEGCDLVLALAHSGPGAADALPGAENAALAVAALDGIDAVIAGHTHERHADPSVPLVLPGANGSDLGVIALEAGAEGRWHVATAALRRVSAEVAEDPALASLVAEDHARAEALMARPVGRVEAPLHSYFTFIAPDRALALVAAAQAAALRPLLAGWPEAGLPLLSAAAPGLFGGRSGPLAYADIPAGPVALRHLVELQPFPNDLHAVVVTGAQLGDWIEHSAGLFNRIVPGADPVALIDPGLPGHDFDVIHGVACEIDLSVPSRFLSDGSLRQGGARRVRRLTYAGRAVMPDQRFVVAVNSYRSSGGGNVAALRGAERLDLPGTGLRAALAGYLGGTARDPLEQAPPPWGFVLLPGARAWLQTGPGAQGHLGELAGRGVEAAGIDGEGFLRLILPL